jgi:8-oxo-dGTP pyrophosphatase MutT (NUDIX family)
MWNKPDPILSLQKQLALPLPGEEAQYRMSRWRLHSTAEYLKQYPNHRESAVALLLWPEADTYRTVLIRRPEYEGAHGGQMALPGGQKDPSDCNLLDTAIRETREEIGVELGADQILGKLSPLYIPVSNYLVQPWVALLEQRPVFHPDPAEVSALLDFDLSLLLLPDTLKSSMRVLGNGLKAETPYYDIEGSEVWGATAMILSELAAVLEEIISS